MILFRYRILSVYVLNTAFNGEHYISAAFCSSLKTTDNQKAIIADILFSIFTFQIYIYIFILYSTPKTEEICIQKDGSRTTTPISSLWRKESTASYIAKKVIVVFHCININSSAIDKFNSQNSLKQPRNLHWQNIHQ